MTEIDVWRCVLDTDDESFAQLTATLSPDEVDRAGRLADSRRQRQALGFYGMRRMVLSRYVDGGPRALVFDRGPHGKPRLSRTGGVEDVCFSVSRSGGLGVVAVTRGRELGVDVERIDPRRALGPIADRLFSADEASGLRSLAVPDRIGRFYELWTRKEAHAKALGTGLALPLHRLGTVADGWSVHDAPVGHGFVCTVCVRDGSARVRVLDYGAARLEVPVGASAR